jgi:hypothetical protein
MKSLIFSTLALCLAAGSARATVVFAETQTPDVVLNTGNSHNEQVWDFTTQPGWSQGLVIESIEVTETFSGIGGGSTFASTIIPYDTTVPNSEAAEFVLFASENVTATKTVTDNVPSPVTLADISNGGTLGQFDTRVSRSTAGSFTLDSITIDITAESPEPATFVLMGAGLAAVAFFARRRRLV